MKWTAADVPDQTGRVAIITGANTGIGSLMFQSAAMGALPALRAATDPQVHGGQYYGPSHLAEQRGYPRPVQSSAASHDEQLQRWLWAVSEQSTGVIYPV